MVDVNYKEEGELPPTKEPPRSSFLTDEEKQAEANEQVEANYWLGQLSTAYDEQRPWFNECRNAWREYQGLNNAWGYRTRSDWRCEVYPRYWADTSLMLSALYSRTPQPVARRQFDSPDPVARTASVLAERRANWLIKTSDFDAVMEASALEFLNSSRATCRMFWNPKKCTSPVKVPVQEVAGEDGQPIYVDSEMNAIPDDVVVQKDSSGELFYDDPTQTETYDEPRITLRTLNFDELRISPGARKQTDIWWKAYRITCTRKEAAERFDPKIVEQIKTPGTRKGMGEGDNGENYLKQSKDLFSYWELWNERDKTVMWLHESYKEGFLKKPEKDPYGLTGFYPSPQFMMDNTRYDSMYPSPDYSLCQDPYEQIHLLYKRINAITRAIRGRAVYDGSDENLVSFFTETWDNEGIASNKWQDVIQKGGFDAMIYYQDTSKLAATLGTIVQVFGDQRQHIDELRGIPEILRGFSGPNKTLGAIKTEERWAALRFYKKQKEVTQFVRNTFAIMLEFMAQVFPVEDLKDIDGFDSLSEEQKSNYDQAVALLCDKENEVIRIDIQTDTLIAFEDDDRKATANEMMQQVGQYINNVAQTMEQQPEMAPPLMGLLGHVLRSYRDARDVEGETEQSFSDLSAKLQAQAQQQKPEPPDYELLKLQSAERIALAEMQSRERIAMQDAQVKIDVAQINANQDDRRWQMGLQGKEYEVNTSAQIELQKIQTQLEKIRGDLQVQLQDLAIKQQGVEIEAQKVGGEALYKQSKAALDRQALAVKTQLAQVDQQLESYKVQLDETEKYMTEARLQQEEARKQIEATTPQAPAQPAAPSAVSIHINQPDQQQVNPLAAALLGGQLG